MQNRMHNLKSFTKRVQHAFTLVMVFTIALPTPSAEAIAKNKLIANPAFAALVLTVARLNQAMRSAAENPQDEFRRKNVRTALQALPPAILGLAAVFKSGRLHNGDLPLVMSMLGGFVDVNAADNYKKFMQAPSAALIPQVGAAMPAHLMQVPAETQSAGSMTIGFDDSRARGVAPKVSDATVGKDSYVDGGRSLASIDVTESTPVGALRDNSSMGRQGLSAAAQDLRAVEARQAALPESTRLSPVNYRLQPKARNWQFGRLLERAESLLIPDAGAAEGECQECEGGGGGGRDAAAILIGFAGVAAAIIPAVVAGMQADADVKIATTQALTQKYMTDSTNANALQMAQIQQSTAMQTAQMQASVAVQNNQGVTERLQMQLASLESARQQAAAAEQQRLALEQQYNQQRIELAQRQADQNIQLANATLSAQLMQAGLSDGTTVANSGLSVSPLGAGQAATAVPTGLASTGRTSQMAGLGMLESSAPATASAGGQLLASLEAPSSGTRGFFASSQEGSEVEEEKSTTVRKEGLTSVRSSSASRLLSALRGTKTQKLAKPLPTGSTAMVAAAAPKASSDIGAFLNAGSSSARGFAAYQNQNGLTRHSATARGIASTAPAAVSSGSGHSAAYKAP